MEAVTCVLCEQPVENCGRHSSRRALSFNILMVQGYEQGVIVPCKFQERLNTLVNNKNWMVVSCPHWVFDFYLQKDVATATICGPYWSYLVRTYDIQQGDVISFVYDEHVNSFSLIVKQLVDDRLEEKLDVGQRVLYDVSPRYRTQLHNTIFSNIREITEQEMAIIIFAIYKVVVITPVRELGEDDFYEHTRELQFFVHKYNEANVFLNGLFLDAKPFNDVGCPVNGSAQFWSDVHRDEPALGQYHIVHHNSQDSHIAFDNGWVEFSEQAGIGNGSVVLMIAEARYDCIALNFIEIGDPVVNNDIDNDLEENDE